VLTLLFFYKEIIMSLINLVCMYVVGVVVLMLDLRARSELSVATATKVVVWPVSVAYSVYNIAAPAVSAVVGYITDFVNVIRGK